MPQRTEDGTTAGDGQSPVAKDSSKRRQHSSRLGDIIVVACFIVAAFGLSFYLRHAEYNRGLTNTFGPGFMGDMVFVLPLALLAVVFFAYGIVRLIGSFCTHKDTALNLLIALLPPISLVASLMLCTPTMPIFMKGFEQWTAKNVDIDTIQQWLASEGAAHAGQRYSRDSLETLPPCLVKPKPRYITFSDPQQGDDLTVELGWGTRNTRRGVIVGPPSMRMPGTNVTERHSNSWEYRRTVRPGVCVVSRW